MQTLDFRGSSYPMPVVDYAEKLSNLETDETFQVILSDPLSADKIIEMCQSRNDVFDARQDEQGTIILTIEVKATVKDRAQHRANEYRNDDEEDENKEEQKKIFVAVPYDAVPGCDRELGEKLVEKFIVGILRMPYEPVAIALYGSAVKLAVSGSPILPMLQEFSTGKCEVLVETDSLEHYGLTKECKTGRSVFFGAIRDRMTQADVVIHP